MRIKILDCSVEHVVKGKSKYSKATVAYSYNGEARTQNIMSFTNPAVFAKVQESVGKEMEVTITKNDAGYNQWASLEEPGSGGEQTSAATSSYTAAPNSIGVRVTGSNYETPVERAKKQVYIVKQSSISAAIALAANNKEKTSPTDVIATAQTFVDWVFTDPTEV